MSRLDKSFINAAFAAYRVWELGNDVLYQLCREHPGHTDEDAIVAKMWLIGRSYAAPIERRRQNLEMLNNDFYRHLANKISESNFGQTLKILSSQKNVNASTTKSAHNSLTQILHGKTGIKNISFSSKYLHFHFPSYFYIYDSKAVSSVGRILKDVARRRISAQAGNADGPYAAFFDNCETLSDHVSGILGRMPRPRELDNILMHWSDTYGRKAT